MIGGTRPKHLPSGGALVPYFLDETKGWALSMESLKEAVKTARIQGKHVRGLVFINPGNPTGAIVQMRKASQSSRGSFRVDEYVSSPARRPVPQRGEPPPAHQVCP